MVKFTFLTLLILSTYSFAQTVLPTGRTSVFAGSGNCAICHSSDGGSVLMYNGYDISPVTYWRATMMANAGKDPFWLAVVAEEVHKYPQLKQTIETTCIKCHSPMGHTEAFYHGQTNYSIAEMKQDAVANDGVSCTVCHQIKPDNFGHAASYSGNYKIDNDSIIYGPYQDPHVTAMKMVSGYDAVYTTHMDKSELCATCHTLFTPYLDNQGNIAGNFPEQTPYLEWKNSQYFSSGTECQDCHLPKINEGIDIATIPPGHQVLRSPYWKHNFVGGNVYMLALMKENINALGISASQENFDSTIVRAENNLKENAIDLSLTSPTIQNDTMFVYVKVENKAGHKIPSGIPLRRMWIHFKITDGTNTVFESGKWDSAGKIIGISNSYEPHYDVINDQDQIQIYEGVMGDVDNQLTYTLLRAASYLKDNRIPPKGFTSSHTSYDTIAIFGNALADLNFNKDGVTEGTGSDIVLYKVPVLANTTYNITAQVCFQSIKTEVVDYLRPVQEPDVTAFVTMYDAVPNIPVIMKTQTTSIVTSLDDEKVVSLNTFSLEQNFPNPFNPITKIKYGIPLSPPILKGESEAGGFVSLKIYDVLGNEVATLVNDYKPAGEYEVEFNAEKLPSGIYYYQFEAGEFKETKKMVLIK